MPPKLATRLLTWVLRGDLAEEVQGDLEEKFISEIEKKTHFKAQINYWWQVMHYLRPFAIKSRSNYSTHFLMLGHYIKISWRNILRSRSFSFINVFGLAFGLSACVLIMLYVVDELQYDQHHLDGERIYRVASKTVSDGWAAAAAPVAGALKSELPEVEQVTRLVRIPGFQTILLKKESENKQFFESNVFYVDSTFFKIFTYDIKFGTKQGLMAPNSIAISETVSTKFFGDEDPVGQPLTVGLSFGDFTYKVGAVFKDDKFKSHIPANILLSLDNTDIGNWAKSQDSWIYNSLFHTYVKLRPETQIDEFEAKVQDLYEERAGDQLREAGFSKTLFLQKMSEIYLYSHLSYEVAANGNMDYLWIFISLALFLLIIACINFMNLSTARSERRAREVGMRKVIGAQKSSLINQFLLESIMMSLLALIFTLIILQFTTPVFNQIIGRQLSIWSNLSLVGLLVILAVLAGLLAGIYPSFYLSSFQPAAVLKGSLKNSFSATVIRKGLVVFQFAISSILILGALLIGQQMHFIQNQNLGFESAHKIIIPLKTPESIGHIVSLKNELLNENQIMDLAVGGSYPGNESITDMLFFGEGKTSQDNVDVQTTYIEPGYEETLGMTLLKGRFFSEEFKSDSNAVILNETAIRQLDYDVETAVGRLVYYGLNGEKYSMRIIGVVKDYHFRGLQTEIEPMALMTSLDFSGPSRFLIANIKSDDYPELIGQMEQVWTSINPGSPFQYSFLDEDFARNYDKEVLTFQLIKSFTFIAIVIACLGLFGLTAFATERRTKEIGVRKVLGANVVQIISLLSKDFVKLVLVGVIIGAPIAYWIMDEWLSSFAYRISISWLIFLVAAFVAVFLALATVSFQATKAAFLNPVKSLRSE